MLYLYFNNQWLPACATDPFNQYVADTVCRQLGYTGAIENGFQYKYLKYKYTKNYSNIYTGKAHSHGISGVLST